MKIQQKKAVEQYLLVPVSRTSLDTKLIPLLKSLDKKNSVLDVGAKHAQYREFLCYNQYLTLDVDDTVQSDYCGDIHTVQLNKKFNLILVIEVLEHLQTPQQAIDNMKHHLVDGGMIILSTRFNQPYHGSPADYYRFSGDGLKFLFKEFSYVKIIPLGNRFSTIIHYAVYRNKILTMFVNIFLKPFIIFLEKKISVSDYHLGYIVIAIK
jgi:hypothetical protein